MFVCKSCWNEFLKWQWQCGYCKEWNTLKEFEEVKWNDKKNNKVESRSLKKLEKNQLNIPRIIWKSEEFNNILGWWIVCWSVILLSWEPWIGKSTLALQMGNWITDSIIYISWEETEFQLEDRATRLNIENKDFHVLSESNLENILATLKNNSSKIVIIDSISVLYSNEISWVSWSISQVRYITEKLVEFAKMNNVAMIIIGHVTKDGNLAWPKTLEHMVDTVLFFEWDKYDDLRILRSLKNRFGSTWEIALFKMNNSWLHDLKNPWLEFVTNNDNTSIWSCLSITMEGSRPLVIETESLTTYTKFGYPKRQARWINNSKLDLIIAVLGKYSQVKLDSHDVYSNISRWLKIDEPWIDLAICASIISSKNNKIIPKNAIFLGEISLTWNIKNIFNLDKRIKEALKLWFTQIFIPESNSINEPWVIKLKNIADLTNIINKF